MTNDEKRSYSFVCNRCETTAEDTSRAGVELFTQHHYETVHPIYTAAAIARSWLTPTPAAQPETALRRRWPSTQPLRVAS